MGRRRMKPSTRPIGGGRPATNGMARITWLYCTNKATKPDKDNGDAASAASSVSKLKKDFKKMSKAFTTFNAQLDQLEENDSDLSGSEAEERKSPISSTIKVFNSPSLSRSSSQGSRIYSTSSPVALRLPSTSDESYCWTASPLWICSATRHLSIKPSRAVIQ